MDAWESPCSKAKDRQAGMVPYKMMSEIFSNSAKENREDSEPAKY